MGHWSVFSSPDRKGVGWEPWRSRPGTYLPAESGMMHGVQMGAVWDDALGLGRSRESKCGKKIPKSRRPLQAGMQGRQLCTCLSTSPCAGATPMSSAEGESGLEPDGARPERAVESGLRPGLGDSLSPEPWRLSFRSLPGYGGHC